MSMPGIEVGRDTCMLGTVGCLENIPAGPSFLFLWATSFASTLPISGQGVLQTFTWMVIVPPSENSDFGAIVIVQWKPNRSGCGNGVAERLHLLLCQNLYWHFVRVIFCESKLWEGDWSAFYCDVLRWWCQIFHHWQNLSIFSDCLSRFTSCPPGPIGRTRDTSGVVSVLFMKMVISCQKVQVHVYQRNMHTNSYNWCLAWWTSWKSCCVITVLSPLIFLYFTDLCFVWNRDKILSAAFSLPGSPSSAFFEF